MKLTGENRSTRGKTCPSATLSTTNPPRTDPGSNPGLRGGGPAANRLGHGTACAGIAGGPFVWTSTYISGSAQGSYHLHFVLVLPTHEPSPAMVSKWALVQKNRLMIAHRGAHITGAKSPWTVNFVRRRRIFVGPQHGTCFTQIAWRLEY
jgi:hypothetical protein